MSHFLLKKRDKMYETFSRDIVGQSGPYFRVLSTHMGLQNPEVWTRSAQYKKSYAQYTEKCLGPYI